MSDGVLVVDKPAGMTSHDVVDHVRRVLSIKKVGHGGTLDPDATGVLIVGVGRATRFLSYSQSSPKRYRAVARLGVSTSTQDASGVVVEERPVLVERADVVAALERFRGEVHQLPPMVSAVKVGGRRLHELARAGNEVERTARSVTVYELALTAWDGADQPHATLEVRCSAGTFVRTLVHDLGESLGCGAHVVSLQRTEAGGFTTGDAIALDEIGVANLRPLRDAVKELPRVEASDDEARLVATGRPLPRAEALEENACVAVVRGDDLLGVYRKSGELLVPDRVVAQ